MDQALAMGMQLFPILLMFVILYFFMIRPQKKREKSVQTMRNELEVGDQVVTIGGVLGRIVAVREDQVTIETGADRVKLHFAKWAIQSKDATLAE